MELKKKTYVRKSVNITLNKKDIIDLLVDAGLINTSNVKVSFDVPGGGDWSNMNIDIDDRNPIKVSYVEESEE